MINRGFKGTLASYYKVTEELKNAITTSSHQLHVHVQSAVTTIVVPHMYETHHQLLHTAH
jgi:hypothetical protein